MRAAVVRDFLPHDVERALDHFRVYPRHIHGDDAEGREEADDIKRSVERGTRLTRQLLSFARRQPIARGAADLNASIQGLRPMLERLLGPAAWSL